MEAKAMARTVRIAPRKARLVIDLIRGKQVGEAYAILKHTPKAASPVVEKVLKSAIANAEHNLNLDISNTLLWKIIIITLYEYQFLLWIRKIKKRSFRVGHSSKRRHK